MAEDQDDLRSIEQITDEEDKLKKLRELDSDNEKLVSQFGASSISEIKELPDFYTFRNGLIYSHRNFDIFLRRLKSGEKSAVVSGFNASMTPHIGHISVFDTNLYFQREHNVQVFMPISDDESYVSGKINDQEEGLKNSILIARAMIAFGYDLKKTHIIIDQIFTQIYNLAIKLSRGINMSEIKAVYGYSNDKNTGLHFYPAIQSAHIIFPNTLGYRNVIVPIGPDEDAHLRVCRDVAEKFGFEKPAVLHSRFLMGTDGTKMSKSKNNAIFLMDSLKSIRKKVMNSYSGGRVSIEEHRKLGGIPEIDVSFQYLKSYFLSPKDSENLYARYKSGEILTGELKTMLFERISKRIEDFQSKYEKIGRKEIMQVLMVNTQVDLDYIFDRLGL
ncbi:MAG: tryptophan--tRNA ligase [Thermoplasmataceae archaeon]